MDVNEQDSANHDDQTDQASSVPNDSTAASESDALSDQEAQEVVGGKKKVVSALGSLVHSGKWPWQD